MRADDERRGRQQQVCQTMSDRVEVCFEFRASQDYMSLL
jgi:hypothetical protein